MFRIVTAESLILTIIIALTLTVSNQAQTYVGDATCMGCHGAADLSGAGYNIAEEYQKTGHPYKFNLIDSAAPVYPDNTSPGLPELPPNTTWADYSGVIGGFGWKARWVKLDGKIYTETETAQYNLEDGSWVPYFFGVDKAYNYDCFKCHTTGPEETGSWNNVTADLGDFAQAGIRCEGCHGPGSEHVASGANLPNVGEELTINRCSDCHQRGGTSNNIIASGGYIKHHEQINELRASKHGDGIGDELTCASCHNSHIALRYPDVAGDGLSGIKTEATCESCHEDRAITIDGVVKSIDCIDCHMPAASKSAIGMQTGNGWRGDVKTHIMAINTAAVTKDAMFTGDGSAVVLDANGLAAVTLDFACLNCHTDQDVAWASSYAMGIHTNGITDTEDDLDIPVDFTLAQNYPNPFNPTTTIEFNVPMASNVKLSIFTVTGELVETLVDNMMPAGYHSVKFGAQNLTSGMYIYTIQAGEFSSTKKMILMK